MSDNLVDLQGKPLERAPDPNRARAALRAVLDEVEAGTLDLADILIIAESYDPNDRSMVRTRLYDSGLTAAMSVFWLEREKLGILFRMQAGPV